VQDRAFTVSIAQKVIDAKRAELRAAASLLAGGACPPPA
jgi:hypothetical protein